MPAPGEDEPQLLRAHGRVAPGLVEDAWSPPAIPSSPSRSTLADDNQILHLDIPALGVDGVLPIDHRPARPEPGRADLSPHAKTSSSSSRPPRRAIPNRPGAAFGAEGLSLTFHKRHLSWPATVAPHGIPCPLVGRDIETVARRRPGAQRLPLRSSRATPSPRSASRTSTTRTARSASPSPTRRSTSTSPQIRTAAPDIGSGGRPSPPPVATAVAHLPASQWPPGITPRGGGAWARGPS